MSKKVFSEEEVALLRANPHVESVTKRTISFTPAFKQKVYDEMMNGAGIRDILLRHGIDPNVLGEMRIKGICEKTIFPPFRQSFQSNNSENRVHRTGRNKSIKLEPKRTRAAQNPQGVLSRLRLLFLLYTFPIRFSFSVKSLRLFTAALVILID